ncbi:MAG: T9SS type A sorting domain-containing protein [Bacteroidetes bacterium]|nr:MAG: T9SS type A sorting domain-containing protein [Bacteroidota bacterium]
MKNKSTSAQFTAIHTKMGSILWLTIFFLPLCDAFSQNTWTPKANLSALGRVHAVGFSIGNKGYIGTGYDQTTYTTSYLVADFWEWDQATNVWTQKADYGGGAVAYAVGFSIGTKGYVGTGAGPTYGGNYKNDFWEYNPATNIWAQKADVGGGIRKGAVGFSIGTKGYIGTGYDGTGNGTQDFWEYDQSTDIWTQKAGYASLWKTAYAVGFSIGSRGYIGTGWGKTSTSSSGTISDFWEWNQLSNTWTQKANFPGVGRFLAVGFSIANKGYIGTGSDKNGDPLQSFWQWDQASNTWTQMPNYGGGPMRGAVGFSIGNKGYIGTGSLAFVKDSLSTGFWEFSDSTACSVTAVISSDPSSTVCVGQNVFISASGGTTYSWNTGVTGANMVAAPNVTTTYSVMVTDAAGCTGIGTITVPVNLGCTATGISQFNADAPQAEVWPNPSNGEFTIKDSGLGIYNLDLYNVTGEKVHSDKILNPKSKILNLDLPDGVYFLRISAIGGEGAAIINKKIIIQK